MRGETLILVGHGSHLNPDSSTPVYQHAQAIRELGEWDQVLEAFWKEEPSLRDALDLVRNPVAVIVPLFLAEGYFTRQLLPRELGFDEPLAERPRQVHYAAPVGTHGEMDSLIIRRAREIVGRREGSLDEFALVIIGHGTERSRTSGDTVYRLVEQIRSRTLFGQVECGFLDEQPEIGEVIAGIDAPNLILVPFFIAEGWHTRETIPEDLGLQGDVTRHAGQTLWYAPPVGTLPEMVEAISDLAADARRSQAHRVGEGSGELIRQAERSFLEQLGRHEALRVMQVVVERGADGSYGIRHVADEATSQTEEPAPSAGWVSGRRLPPQATIDDFRQFALEVARFNADGEYRPLRSAPDLRNGWFFHALSEREMLAVLGVLYPAALLRWHQRQTGELRVIDFSPWANRQTAMYESVRELSPDELRTVIRDTCGPCLRRRQWSAVGVGPEAIDLPDDQLGVPCPEPCTVFATEAREHAAACRNAEDGPA